MKIPMQNSREYPVRIEYIGAVGCRPYLWIGSDELSTNGYIGAIWTIKQAKQLKRLCEKIIENKGAGGSRNCNVLDAWVKSNGH